MRSRQDSVRQLGKDIILEDVWQSYRIAEELFAFHDTSMYMD
jgi:hypothetical protein